jgi:hypothetical protein
MSFARLWSLPISFKKGGGKKAIKPRKGRPDTLLSYLFFKALNNPDHKRKRATGVGKKGISRETLNAQLDQMRCGLEPQKVSRQSSKRGAKAKAREALARVKDEEMQTKEAGREMLRHLRKKAKHRASSGALGMATVSLETTVATAT